MSQASISTRPTVDTKKVSGRPELRFDSLEQCLAYAQRLAAAEQAGTLTQLGNWTLGECFSHLASYANYAFDGYPPLKLPLLLKLALRLFKGQVLYGRPRPGIRLPGTTEGTTGVQKLPTQEALKMLQDAFLRLNGNLPPAPNPVFGPLTHPQWMALHTRHAELHLSFYKIG